MGIEDLLAEGRRAEEIRHSTTVLKEFFGPEMQSYMEVKPNASLRGFWDQWMLNADAGDKTGRVNPLGGCHNEPGEGPPILISGDSSGAGTTYSTLLSLAKGGPRSLNGGRDELAGGIFFSGFFDLQCNTIGYMEKFYNGPNKSGGGYWNQGSTDGASGKTPPSSWAQTPAEYAWYNCRKLAKNYMGNLE